MKLTTKTLFEAYQEDASNNSKLAIIRTGFYYIGAIYPTNEQSRERIALVFWSQFHPCFTSLKVFKFDMTTLCNYGSKSNSKHIPFKKLLGTIIEVTTIAHTTNSTSYPYQVEWEILKEVAQSTDFDCLRESKTHSLDIESLEAVSTSLNDIAIHNVQKIVPASDEIPEEDILENSHEDELEIPEEILDEEFLKELDQLLYDEQISMDGDSYMNELLQLLWDEQREDRPDNGFENQEEEL